MVIIESQCEISLISVQTWVFQYFFKILNFRNVHNEDFETLTHSLRCNVMFNCPSTGARLFSKVTLLAADYEKFFDNVSLR